MKCAACGLPRMKFRSCTKETLPLPLVKKVKSKDPPFMICSYCIADANQQLIEAAKRAK